MSVAAHITCQRREFGVPHAVACRALGVSPSWYYKWRDRPPTPRQARRAEQNTAEAFELACRRLGVTQSMARVGSCSDNACAEAFNSTIKVEYVYRQHFPTKPGAIEKISGWINGFYNTRRRHSAAGGMSPIDFEQFITEARRTSTT